MPLPSGQGAAEALHEAAFVRLGQGVLPNPQHTPALGAQDAADLSIPCPIAVQFPLPKHAIMAWLGAVLWAAVPETAVHENRQPLGAKGEIRFAKQVPMTPPAGDAMPPENLCKGQFRLLVAGRADSGHHFGALRFGEYVGHLFLRLFKHDLPRAD